MTTATDTCWADPLTRAERRVLREKLARACKRSYVAARYVVARDPQPADIEAMRGLTIISAEMSDLHLDVTERAGVPTPVTGDRHREKPLSLRLGDLRPRLERFAHENGRPVRGVILDAVRAWLDRPEYRSRREDPSTPEGER